MCHDWWLKRRFEEGEASRELWDEFERTRPLNEPECTCAGEASSTARLDTSEYVNHGEVPSSNPGFRMRFTGAASGAPSDPACASAAS